VDDTCGVVKGSRGLWYALSATDRDAIFQVTVAPNQSFLANIAIYFGPDCQNIMCYKSYDFVVGGNEEFTLAVDRGQTAKMLVGGYNDNEYGVVSVDIKVSLTSVSCSSHTGDECSCSCLHFALTTLALKIARSSAQ